jgi:TetR/AcrR family transcriptional regulator, transcriptional repressor for nem operon
MYKKHNIEDILEKGEEIFRKKGFNKTGVEEIIQSCGIPKGSFYNFFKSKEEFGVKTLDHYTEKQYKTVKELLSDSDISPTERLMNFYLGMIEFNENENFSYGCLLGNMAQEMAGLSERISAEVDRDLRRITSVIASCINEGQNKNEMRNDFTAEELAQYLQNGFYGALLRAKAEKNKESFQLFMRTSFEFIKK